MICDVEVDEFAPVMAEDNEDEEETEGEGGHNEEVDSDHVAEVSRQKSPPRRGGPRRHPVHVLGDGQLGDLVSQECELRLDAPPTPGRVVQCQAPDQMANVRVEQRAADSVGTGLPSPVELEALAVPRHDRGGLHDGQAGSPPHPDAGQPDPEDPVPPRQVGSAHRPLEDQELMAERQVLEGEGRRPEE
jgi:hypothetical protein